LELKVIGLQVTFYVLILRWRQSLAQLLPTPFCVYIGMYAYSRHVLCIKFPPATYLGEPF